MSLNPYNLGPETVLNTVTAGSQEFADYPPSTSPSQLATLTDGFVVSVWDDQNTGLVDFRLLAPDAPAGAETSVATGSQGTVAALPDGDFAVVYFTGTSSTAILEEQLYSSAGVALGGPNALFGSSATGQEVEPSPVGLADGDFALTFDFEGRGGSNFSYIYTYVFTATGGFVSSHLDATLSASVNYSGFPKVIQLANGNLATVWQDGQGHAAYAITTEAGASVASGSLGLAANSLSYPTAAALANGNWVVSWTDNTTRTIDYDVLTPTGGSVITNQVASSPGEAPFSSTIAALTGSDYLISWENDSPTNSGDGSASSVKARLFDSSGASIGNEFLVNTITNSSQGSPILTTLSDGTGVYDGWTDFSGQAVAGQTADTSPPGVKGQAIEFYDPTNFSGAAQIFWDNTSNQVAISSMNGLTQLEPTQSLGSVTPDWSVAGIGDFSGNGQEDMLWRNTTGQDAIWFMDGNQVTSQQYTNSATPDWSVAGIGDFSGNGKSDILWYDAASDQYAIWLMNGATVASAQLLTAPTPDWSVAGIGDFSGNGKDDILWRNTSGQDAIWFMNGTTVTSEVSTNSATTDWSVAGVGDFTGNGTADILWRNASGQDVIWDMSGATVLSAQYTESATTDWHVAGVTDFNHDKHDDILWQNTSGQLAIWEMNNTTVLNQGIVGTSTPDWHPYVGSTA